jgi:hypothetical protein
VQVRAKPVVTFLDRMAGPAGGVEGEFAFPGSGFRILG